VQLELDFLQPVCYVLVIYTLDEHIPAVCVIFWHALRFWVRDWVEGASCGAEDEGSKDLYSLHARLLLIIWWGHLQ
jgi:hypothetical protein